MDTSSLALVVLVALMLSLVGVAIGRRSVRLALVVVAALALWLALAAALAASGVLAVWSARPPRVLLLPLSVLATSVVLMRTARLQALIAGTPRAWPIAAQTFRVGVELALYALFVEGRAPVQVTFEGRNLDILVGLSAPLLAYLVARRKVSPLLPLAWNVLGVAILANTIGTFATSVPGPLHLDWPGAPFTAPASWPVVWLPAFLAPLALFLHGVSLRQTVPLLREAAAARRSSAPAVGA